jgi:membrane associated rhomboid family serine protease
MPDLPRRRSTQGQGPDWLRRITGRLTTTIKTLVLINFCVYLFYVFARNYRGFFIQHLALGPGFFAGEIWQPVTSLFVHLDFIGFVLNTIGLWYAGVAIERTVGARRCTALYFAGGLLANLTIAGTWWLRGFGTIPFVDGCAFRHDGLFVAFARLYGRQPIQFWPTTLMVQARYLCLILVGIAQPSCWRKVICRGWRVWPSRSPSGSSARRRAAGDPAYLLRERARHLDGPPLRRRFGVIEGGERRSKKYVN